MIDLRLLDHFPFSMASTALVSDGSNAQVLLSYLVYDT